jgi:hypothetical protein
VLAYERASSISVPVDLVACSAGTVPANEELRSAIEANHTALQRVLEVFRLLKPLVVLALNAMFAKPPSDPNIMRWHRAMVT